MLFVVASFMLSDGDRKSTRLNSSHLVISYAVFCLKKNLDDPVVEKTQQFGLERHWQIADFIQHQGTAVLFFNDTATTDIYTLSLHDALPIWFSFAQTIDPTTQGESGVLLVFAQLAGGMVFLSLGLDREVIRTLAYSLEAH